MAPQTDADRFQAIINHLREARVPQLPPPPTGPIRRLLVLITFFKVATLVILPLFCVALIAVPTALRMMWDIRIPGVGFVVWVASAATLVAFWRAFFRKRTESTPTVTFRRDRDHRLFDLLDAAAHCVGTLPVARVVVSPGDGFAVREGKPSWFFMPGELTLHLAWIDLEELDLAEMTSILLHEFAHYSEGHTAIARKLYRRADLLFRLRAELEDDSWTNWNPVYWWVRWFTGVFEKRYAAISRHHELQSDAMAIGVLGADAFARALRKVVVNDIALDARIGPILEPAIEAVDLERNVVQEMLEHRPSDQEQAWVDDAVEATLGEPTAPLDHHPSIHERIAHAIEMRTKDPSLASERLTDLRGGGAAYDFLFDRQRLHAELSRALIAQNVARRQTTSGLRGEFQIPQRDGVSPVMRVPRMSTPVFLVALGTEILGLLVIGFLVLGAIYVPETLGDVLTAAVVMCVGLLAALVYTMKLRRAYVEADGQGVTSDGPFVRRSLAWSQVSGLRSDDEKTVVIGFDGENVLRIRVRGSHRQRMAFGDMVLEHAPQLGFLAWGTGLARVPEPDSSVANLPTRVYEKMSDLIIEGPGETRYVIPERHPGYDDVREYLQTRLLPLLERTRSA